MCTAGGFGRSGHEKQVPLALQMLRVTHRMKRGLCSRCSFQSHYFHNESLANFGGSAVTGVKKEMCGTQLLNISPSLHAHLHRERVTGLFHLRSLNDFLPSSCWGKKLVLSSEWPRE